MLFSSFPAGSAGLKQSRALGYFLFLLLSLISSAAYAIDLNSFGVTPPPDSDLSLQGINRIFGLSSADSEFNVLSSIMGIWNGSMMFIGAIIVGYIIIAGVLKTAHDGTALGQNWNSMWIPFRASMGLAATAPILGGYCAIQMITVWAAIQGVGIADMMWSKAVQQISTNGGYVVSPKVDAGSLEVVENLYKAASCEVATNKFINKDRDASPESYGSEPFVKMTPYGELGNRAEKHLIETITLGLKDTGGYGIKFADNQGLFNCGGFEWSVTDRNFAELEASTAGGLGNINFEAANPFGGMSNQIISTQRAAILNMYNQMLPMVVKEQDSEKPEAITAEQVKGLIDQYAQTMGGMVQNVQSFVDNQGLKEFGSQASKDGWAMAGAYYARISHFNASANDLAHSAPNGINMEPAISGKDEISRAMDQAEANMQALKTEMTPGAKLQQDDLTGKGFVESLKHPFLNMQSGMILLIQKSGDPLTRMQNMGHLILDAAYVIGAAMAVGGTSTKVASEAISQVGGKLGKAFGGILSGLFSFIGSLLMMMFIAGIFMAFVLPLIPFILMLFSVMSWYTSLFIAFVAAPLWAISHATPDGHEAFGSGSNGYILLMSIVLRPALTIMAMFGSMAILYAMDILLNTGYMAAFAGSQANSISGPIGMITGIILYCIISLILVYSAYHMTQTIPNSILQWIGGRDDDSIGVNDHNNRVVGAVWMSGRTGMDAAGAAHSKMGKKDGTSNGIKSPKADLNPGVIKGDSPE